MIRQALIILAFLLCDGSVSAQVAPFLEWQKPLGGSLMENAFAIVQSVDSGYVAVGYAHSTDGDVFGNHGARDLWMVKLNASGDLLWQKALGGSDFDDAQAIELTQDGGFILAGWTYSINGDVTSNHGLADVWVLKLDSAGTTQWQETLGGTATDEAFSIQLTTDGGFILAGYSNSHDGDASGNHGNIDFWVVKLDGSGSIKWQKMLGGSDADQANAVLQTSDGGYIAAGYTYSSNYDVSGWHGGMDAWVVKLDSSGTIQWQKALGGTLDDQGWAILETDSGYLVVGSTASNDGDASGNHGDRDAWIVQLGDSGVILWQKELGGSGTDQASSIEPDPPSGFVVAGFTGSNDGDVSVNHGAQDLWLFRIDSIGDLQWQEARGGSGYEEAFAVHRTFDAGYIAAGYTESNNDGDVSGYHVYNEYSDMWVVKFGKEDLELGMQDRGNAAFTIAPNPTQDVLRISIPSPLQDARVTLTDALGREVLHERMSGTNCTLDLGGKPHGLYLLTLRSAQGISSQRVVVE